MYIGLNYNKGLSKELLQGIENRKYSVEELTAMHRELKGKYANKTKGYSLAFTIVIVCFVFVMALSVIKRSGNTATLPVIFIGLVLIIVIAAIFLKNNLRDKSKKQFVKVVEKGYPELAERFDENSFH